MKFLTRYRLKKALRQIEPQREKKNLKEKIKYFFMLKFPIIFVFRRFNQWFDKQPKGTILFLILTILIFSFFVLNQLRYHYWLNIMKSNYPQDVIEITDKVLVQWNARYNAAFFILFHMLIAIFLAVFNHIYNSDEPQTIPGTFKIK